MQLSDAARAEVQKERCYTAHNYALRRACRVQGWYIHKLLEVSSPYELIWRLKAQLQKHHWYHEDIKPHVARALLNKVGSGCGTRGSCCC
jgi:hypothetical protein